MKRIAISLLLIFSCCLFSCSDEFEPAEQTFVNPDDENPDPENPDPVPGQPFFGPAFIEGSELYHLLIRATQNTGVRLEDITCINFVYPLAIKKYDASFTSLGTTTIHNDAQFYNYLLALGPNQPISLSYPIQTVNSNGELFSVNNNAELLDNLKICMRETVLAICNGMLSPPQAECYWRVPYGYGSDNTYAGGRFFSNGDLTVTFEYDGQEYPGNWIFLFVGDELHMNINLEGTSAVATYWNIDRPVVISPDEKLITILNGGQNIQLEKYCGTLDEFAIGDTGPGGGIVFYDKGEYSDGWRYMEVAMVNLNVSQWGCPGLTSGSPSQNGIINSVVAANYYDANSCNAVAARAALLWTNNGKNDWFLPSEQELQLIYTNLQTAGLGNFVPDLYWSSTEQDADNARAINFMDGTATDLPKSSTEVRARAVRYF